MSSTSSQGAASASPRRTLSRTNRRGSRRSSTVARLHAAAIAARNRRASLAAQAALEEKAFLEESKSSSSLVSSKSSNSVSSKSHSNSGKIKVDEIDASESPETTRSFGGVSNGSTKTQKSFLSVEPSPFIHRRSFDSATTSRASSDLLSVTNSRENSKALAVSDTCIDSKKIPSNRHTSLDQRLTIDQPYYLSPRRSFDSSAPRRRASSSPRPSLTPSAIGYRRPSACVQPEDDSTEEEIAETSFVSRAPVIHRPSLVDYPTSPRASFSNLPPVHRRISVSKDPTLQSISFEEENLLGRKKSLADYPRKRETLTATVSGPPEYRRKLSSARSEYVPLSRKSSYVPDLSTWKSSVDSPLLEAVEREHRRRNDSSTSYHSHLDIYRRHSSSASRISAPETGNRGSMQWLRVEEEGRVRASSAPTSRRTSSNIYNSSSALEERQQLFTSIPLPVKSTSHVMASYGSIAYQMRDANLDSSSTLAFVFKAFKILGRTVFTTGLLMVSMAVPLLMVILGIQYLHECPIEPHIPIYLLVGGLFGALKGMWLICQQVRSRRYERIDDAFADDGLDEIFTSISYRATDVVLSVFLVVWFGLGNYWVYKIYLPRYEAPLFQPNDWCSKTVYLFALSQLLFVYTVTAVLLLISISLSCWRRCVTCFGEQYK
ncbi:uncharacterized protein LOC125178413 [Hyalella azteca]|uniref:Uncharacterized protein LOC125178413 n=1 Tax=Hyalella azteca TaxID=294128 RepID=A0A979FMZ4_HYAAZ|nr:uncharacterized protein LOC125178413 [Hyalella azteca]